MPTAKVEIIHQSSSLLLWEIKESEEMLQNAYRPKPHELVELKEITHPVKKQEWLSSRLCLSELCGHMKVSYNGIIKDIYGKPHLQGNDAQISISHCFPVAGAILDLDQPTGIDIELPQQKMLSVGDRYCSEKEWKFAHKDVDILTIIWAAKETLYKIHGKKKLIFKENLCVESFELNDEGDTNAHIHLNGASESFQLKYFRWKDYWVVHKY
jgi:4'-phosphopantetheinyl transferase